MTEIRPALCPCGKPGQFWSCLHEVVFCSDRCYEAVKRKITVDKQALAELRELLAATRRRVEELLRRLSPK